MPLAPYDEETFIAFTDISGFKEMMRSGDKAAQAMNSFYNAGYAALEQENNVNGLFVSDCAILFSLSGSTEVRLDSLLSVLKNINRTLLPNGIMLTSSIAWGHFSYHDRIEFPGIGKQPIFGNGYLAAFLDNEIGSPRIQPGQCRIVKKGLGSIINVPQFNLLEETAKHFQYFWNVDSPEEIGNFKARYHDSYNLKYAGMLSVLRMSG